MINEDCNLLFGVLAVQMDFVTRDAVIAAMHAWVLEKSKPLGRNLIEQRALSLAQHDLLEQLVNEPLAADGGDAEKSLVATDGLGASGDELKQLADPVLDATLDRIPSDTDAAQNGPEGAADPSGRARFLLEAEITGRLEHPRVVPEPQDVRPLTATTAPSGAAASLPSRLVFADALHGGCPTRKTCRLVGSPGALVRRDELLQPLSDPQPDYRRLLPGRLQDHRPEPRRRVILVPPDDRGERRLRLRILVAVRAPEPGLGPPCASRKVRAFETNGGRPAGAGGMSGLPIWLADPRFSVSSFWGGSPRGLTPGRSRWLGASFQI